MFPVGQKTTAMQCIVEDRGMMNDYPPLAATLVSLDWFCSM
jgi:hypothetical protein